MAFNVGALTQWVNDNSQELLTKAVLQAETIPYVTVIPGIKYKERLKYLATDALIQQGGCGFTGSGTTTLDEKDILVTSLKVTEELCPEDLNSYSLQLSMKPGYNTNIPFEALYAEQKVKEIQKGIEIMIWGNQAASATAFAGFQNLLNADGDVHDYTSFTWCSTGNTASDFLGAIYAMINLLPAEIQGFDDLHLFVGHEVFRKITQALVIANLYHIDLTSNNGLTPFMFPGTNVKLVPLNGLNGTCVTCLTPASNLIYATDLQSEEDKLKVWWSEDYQIVRMVCNWKSGVSYYFGDYIVFGH